MSSSGPNPGGHFRFRVGDRVTATYPGKVYLGRVVARTVEAALGKTYQVRDQRGRNLGFIPESRLEAR